MLRTCSVVGPGHREQSQFLQRHDRKTRKLWFLWPSSTKVPSGEKSGKKCGCIGGCEFFGMARPLLNDITRTDAHRPCSWLHAHAEESGECVDVLWCIVCFPIVH